MPDIIASCFWDRPWATRNFLIDRGLGSIDFQAAARSVLIVGRLREQPEVRVVAHAKSSLAPEGQSLAFELNPESGFRWLGHYNISADDLLAGVATLKTERSNTMNEQKSWYPTPVQRSMLDFIKEQEPQLYVELKAEGTLPEYLRDYSHWYHDKVDMITEQMGGNANAAACARKIVRAMSFEGREAYE